MIINLISLYFSKERQTEVIKIKEHFEYCSSQLYSLSVQNSVVKNTICPHCSNKGIVDKIARTKGSVDGDFFLGSGSIHGETDTYAVNKCQKCGHEWIKSYANLKGYKDLFDDQLFKVTYYKERYSNILKNYDIQVIYDMMTIINPDSFFTNEFFKLTPETLISWGFKCQNLRSVKMIRYISIVFSKIFSVYTFLFIVILLFISLFFIPHYVATH